MKFFIRFEMDNDIFRPVPNFEINRILNKIAFLADTSDFFEEFICTIYDFNGNAIGKWGVME